jgi:hypothetical protein
MARTAEQFEEVWAGLLGLGVYLQVLRCKSGLLMQAGLTMCR